MLRSVTVLLTLIFLFSLTVAGGCGDSKPAGSSGKDAAREKSGSPTVQPINVEPGADSKSAPPVKVQLDPREEFKQTVLRKQKSVDPEERFGAIEMVLEDSDKTFGAEVLVKLMSDENEDVRSMAAEAMGMGKFTSGVPTLKNAATSDEDPLVRSKCLKSLFELSGAAAVPDLTRALASDEEGTVRAQAAALLGATGSGLGVDPLIKALQEDFSQAVRVSALSALKTMKPQRCYDAVVVALEDRNESVRSEAAQLLGALKNKKAVRPLMNALESEEVSRILLDITTALSVLTGVENEYAIDQSPEDQEEALQLWKDWWTENKENF